ncbi:hypothetical protein SPRG_00030 [Saprolegnia parasitica CBS 223.65]|uniref:Dolichol phosphate-mannose biosynthesis regulatory protein n=1 Tax=Saprolegnia parasitica (strain CBS 223.65) TaxID=695850 RepID=A0A067CWZ3_SAPPC|nr:hypothetical protein SPRG_00030 [Saprolegnia parasitica CBS 223.65]KDO35184.1 hypothetical protein SPRG_00030 [Saprolegnia parasitica CBS 223.65]|eukprot:XP_012193536.1 hypothetical protein SPRG_00030 [Saprolegnia parasitica CBS 223.65]
MAATWCLMLVVAVAAADNRYEPGTTPSMQAVVLGLPVWAWILIGCALLAGAGYGLCRHLEKKMAADDAALPVVYVEAKSTKASPAIVLADAASIALAKPAPPPHVVV